MFDIGFWELALIAVVALVVIGPERLPGVARTAGKWIGNARRFVSSVQSDIKAEVGKADELKRMLEEQTQLQSMHEIIETTVNGEDERKPVPRAKPDYIVKAMPDVPIAKDTASPSESDQKEQSAELKHD